MILRLAIDEPAGAPEIESVELEEVVWVEVSEIDPPPVNVVCGVRQVRGAAELA